jgi:hypothetical protein
MFRATLVADGMAFATWKRTLKATKVTVEVEPIGKLSAARRKQIPSAFAPYATFLGRELDLRITD